MTSDETGLMTGLVSTESDTDPLEFFNPEPRLESPQGASLGPPFAVMAPRAVSPQGPARISPFLEAINAVEQRLRALDERHRHTEERLTAIETLLAETKTSVRSSDQSARTRAMASIAMHVKHSASRAAANFDVVVGVVTRFRQRVNIRARRCAVDFLSLLEIVYAVGVRSLKLIATRVRNSGRRATANFVILLDVVTRLSRRVDLRGRHRTVGVLAVLVLVSAVVMRYFGAAVATDARIAAPQPPPLASYAVASNPSPSDASTNALLIPADSEPPSAEPDQTNTPPQILEIEERPAVFLTTEAADSAPPEPAPQSPPPASAAKQPRPPQSATPASAPAVTGNSAPPSDNGQQASAKAQPRPTERPALFVGTLAVRSEPDGAAVFLNGQPVGTTPLQLGPVRAGSYALRIEHEGYQRWTASVLVPADKLTNIDAKLPVHDTVPR